MKPIPEAVRPLMDIRRRARVIVHEENEGPMKNATGWGCTARYFGAAMAHGNAGMQVREMVARARGGA